MRKTFYLERNDWLALELWVYLVVTEHNVQSLTDLVLLSDLTALLNINEVLHRAR